MNNCENCINNVILNLSAQCPQKNLNIMNVRRNIVFNLPQHIFSLINHHYCDCNNFFFNGNSISVFPKLLSIRTR